MTLRTYSIIVTGVAAAALATLGLWLLSTCDVCMILIADGVIAFITAGIAAVDKDLTDFTEFRRNRKRKKPLYIYDLS